MRFNDVCLAALCACRFNDVGIDRALGEPFNSLEFVRLFVEYVNEQAANDLAFFLGVVDPFEACKKTVGRIYPNNIDVHVIGEHVHDLVAFVMTQKTMVDKDTGKLVTNRLME